MVGRTPPSAADALVGSLCCADAGDFVGEERVQGTRADQGVRPTIMTDSQIWEDQVAWGESACPTVALR
jgi:hypothetical protein